MAELIYRFIIKMKYNCNMCDYFTNDSSHYKRHLKFKKHKLNSVDDILNNTCQVDTDHKV